MRVGLSTAAFYGRYETEEAAAYMSGLDIDCAEAFLQTASEYTVDFAKTVRRNLRGIPCTSVHPLGTNYENGMFSRSPRQRSDAFDVFRRVLDAGCELGARCYVYHGRHSPQMRALPWDLEANAAVLRTMMDEAKARGMAIAWENVYWCQLTAPERVREAKAMLPDVRFTLDIKQAMKAGADPIEMARAMGDRLMNVHICDWREDGSLCLPGEGCFDFAALLDALDEAGYDGPVIIEPYLALISSGAALTGSIGHIRRMLIIYNYNT